jgi:hypothetical protein
MMAIDKKMAIRLAKVCQWVYDFSPSKKAELLKFRGKLPQRTRQIRDDKSVRTSFAGVIEYPDIVVVAFQGTITEVALDGEFQSDTLIDWINNFRIKQLPNTKTNLPGLVHEGFFEQLDLIAEKVMNALPKDGNKPIVVTGHSQGGAVATLATKLLADNGFPLRESYTFAAPRAGDADFAKSVKTPVYRVEYGDDIVPHVPPTLDHGSVISDVLSLVPSFALPEMLRSFKKLVNRIKDQSYVGVGKLTYRNEEGDLLADRTAAQEKALFNKRKFQLLSARKDLVEHHHLPHYIDMFS